MSEEKETEQRKRERISQLVREIYQGREETFVPGETFIPTGWAVYDDKEVNAVVSTVLNKLDPCSCIELNTNPMYTQMLV